ncbi:alanine racemase [Actinobacteria bacterium YIM 96077]|uniref:Alanine racemase n=1 Tax=Phytoactinopolyspora halophila TaxID=1981511 RepID=A0A329QI99_9ACTN|nr:alanine racemase [Phytoactinopolyspora halophila]AYY15701.1 alanine racemase [Actinobacteria bacterium YIM 96077]RAW11651.1 alanine racemase [Phytoactinopolyspora halophila]
MSDAVPHAEVEIDLNAIRDNVAQLCDRAGDAQVMAVVKGDAYGHGLVRAARAARAGGATWLGTAVLAEALALRAAGDRGRLMAWLYAPGERFADALAEEIDLSASAPWTVDAIADAARETGRTARLHLKIDTGLGRSGAAEARWPELVDAALKAQAEGLVNVVGLWSHFAVADEPEHPANLAQLETYHSAVAMAESRGVAPEVRHLANSAATLMLPQAHFDLVRTGLSIYGLSPSPQAAPAHEIGLRPAMSVRARLALVKRVPAGQGISYGHLHVTDRETNLALVPMGYADGIPRHGSGGAGGPGAPLLVGDTIRRVTGRVCMDQLVVDIGDDDLRAGDEVVLFGDPARGEPSAQDWADACGTISYEIVTRMAPRLPRTYLGADGGTSQ